MSDQIEPCTCNQPPETTLRTKKLKLQGARDVDALTPEGRWHAVQAGEAVFKIALVQPSAERIEEDARRAAAAAEESEKQAVVDQLREKRRAGKKLTAAELQTLLDHLLGV